MAPERHIDDKGNGKLSFQAHFHNFPFSVSLYSNTKFPAHCVKPLP
jgi:hypothetical protein